MAEKSVAELRKQAEEKDLFQRQQAYLATFPLESPTVMLVLEDLSKFCRAQESTFNADPRVHALQEGRREVFLRISEYLNLSSKQLWDLRTNKR